jgi:hypothetical protein
MNLDGGHRSNEQALLTMRSEILDNENRSDPYARFGNVFEAIKQLAGGRRQLLVDLRLTSIQLRQLKRPFDLGQLTGYVGVLEAAANASDRPSIEGASANAGLEGSIETQSPRKAIHRRKHPPGIILVIGVEVDINVYVR